MTYPPVHPEDVEDLRRMITVLKDEKEVMSEALNDAYEFAHGMSFSSSKIRREWACRVMQSIERARNV